MTFKEKLANEHPEFVSDSFRGGCARCPADYGYSDDHFTTCGDDFDCKFCWNREIPEEKEEYGMICPTETEYRYINGAPSGDAAKAQIEAVRLAANATQYLPVETIYAILGIREYRIWKPEW